MSTKLTLQYTPEYACKPQKKKKMTQQNVVSNSYNIKNTNSIVCPEQQKRLLGLSDLMLHTLKIEFHSIFT